jgi:hypothetical protein
LRRASEQASAELLAIKLFKHDVAAVGVAELRLLGAAVRRLWLGLPATILLGVPLVVLLLELAPRYERRPLAPGETMVIEIANPDTTLTVTPGLVVETPVLRDVQRHRAMWRIRANGGSPAEVDWNLGGYPHRTPVDVADNPHGRWLRPDRTSSAQKGLVVKHYPRRAFAIFGVAMTWWLALLAGSMLFAWLFGRALGVRY